MQLFPSNSKVLNEPPRHVTRFIALAKVANKEKLKWLYAFNVVPLTAMDKKELTAQPADATDSPYTGKELEVKKGTVQLVFEVPPSFFSSLTSHISMAFLPTR